jgi:hypothetical protein
MPSDLTVAHQNVLTVDTGYLFPVTGGVMTPMIGGEYHIWLNGDKDKQVRLFCGMSGVTRASTLCSPGTNDSQVAHPLRWATMPRKFAFLGNEAQRIRRLKQ